MKYTGEKKTDRGNTAHVNNHRHTIVEGEQLSPGERVWIPDLRTEGLVVKNLGNPRSVTIGTPKSATPGESSAASETRASTLFTTNFKI